MSSASVRLTHACAINVGYPTRVNRRGTVDVPEMAVGAATLPLLAALVHRERPDCIVHQWDEIGTAIDFDLLDDLPRERTLILLSVRTNLAYEARQLARRLMALGFAVVIGGPHASACLEEVRSYANAAVHGEAEVHLPDVIAAFEARAFDASTLPGLVFRSTETADLTDSPHPERWRYAASDHYMHPGVLEFGRGCQFRCSFCASTNLYTDTLRYKKIDQVLAEIAMLPEHVGRIRSWFFGDDNFASSHPRAIALARAIGRRYPRARWGAAMTIASANDGPLLDALAEGGLRYLFIGFDSVHEASLAETGKTLAPARRFRSLVAAIKRRKISIIAALVLGFDSDRRDVFARTLDWALESGVDLVNLNVLRPYPSSPIYGELRAQGRLFHDPWWMQPFETRLQMVHGLTANVSGVMTPFEPRHMSARELAEGTLWIGQEFYRLTRTVPRLLCNASALSTTILDGLASYFYAREYRTFAPLLAHATTQPAAL